MPTITFQPGEKKVHAAAGELLIDVIKKAGLTVEAPCGGHGVCGKCVVKIVSGAVEFHNDGRLTDEFLRQGYVLACRAKLIDQPAQVQLLSDRDMEEGKFTDMADDRRLIDPALLPGRADLNPLVKKTIIAVPAPAPADGLSDYDRLKKAAVAALGGRTIELPLSLLRNLPEALRQEDGRIALSYFMDNDCIRIVDIDAARNLSRNYGVSVDIGTTTVAVQLVDMNDAQVLAAKTEYNGQIACGLDVISRINYAKNSERLGELRGRVLETINGMIVDLAASRGVEPRFIYNASLAGNTTMVHLLLGITPEYIRLDPYTPAVYDVPYYRASEIGLSINPNTIAYLAPSVGSYVGGDITSGLLCTSLATSSEEICLFIDIGTNGELILGSADFLIGCACSAGPAFEGGGIEHGMRASRGAIEHVEVDKATGIPHYSTIGNVAPLGLCGSGIISLIAGLFAQGWLDAAGKLDRTRPCSRIQPYGKQAIYLIASAEESGHGKPIHLSEADISGFIRAKAAIFSACAVMLEKVSMTFDDLERVYIAGGFGRYLNTEYAKTIGLLPNLPEEKYHFLGNSSMQGAYMTLISQKHRQLEAELAQKITYIDLSTEPDYMNQYTAALFLPHTDARLFPRETDA